MSFGLLSDDACIVVEYIKINRKLVIIFVDNRILVTFASVKNSLNFNSVEKEVICGDESQRGYILI